MGETPPADVSKVENVTVEVRSGEPAVVVAKQPERSNVNENKWNCHFGFRQKTSDVSKVPLASNVQPFDSEGSPTTEGEAYFVQGIASKKEAVQVSSANQLEMKADTDDDGTKTITEFMKKHYEADYTTVRNSIWEVYPSYESSEGNRERNPCLGRTLSDVRNC